MKYNYLKMAEILKKMRIKRGLSTRDLASMVGVSHAEISRIENGNRVSMGIITLIEICEVLKIDFFKLLKATNYYPHACKEESVPFRKNPKFRIRKKIPKDDCFLVFLIGDDDNE